MGDAVSKIGNGVAEWAVNLICSHPTFIGWAIGVFLLSTLVNTGIKGTWTYVEMPRWARFVLFFTMPLALNFYHFAAKAGVQEPTVPSSSIQDAEKP